MNNENCSARPTFTQSLSRLLLVVAGIALGQFILYGPSLIGQKYLLPLDILQQSDYYIPTGPELATFYPQDPIYLDKVLQFEPDRRFAVSEFKAGRFPLWTPLQYGGVPFIWPKYSPFALVSCLTESPFALAWAQMLAALVAGIGAYCFSRRTLGVSFWPAAIVAWCYPLTGFFVFWQGYATCAAAYWLPWLLLAVDRTVHGARLGPVGLGVVTGLTLVSGHIDVAGQVLLVSGLFALWRLWEVHYRENKRQLLTRTSVLLAFGWGLGFMLGAPHVLPLVEYARTGYRMLHRSTGTEERPPAGLVALPHAVLPDMYGSTQNRACPLYQKAVTNLPESSAATYAGILATLVVAPWAWTSRRHRLLNRFWILLAVFGLSWCVNLPGIVQLLRLPGLNFMSHNRLVFATAFAILALAAVGLQNLIEGAATWRRGYWLPFILLAGLCAWCGYRSIVFPESVTGRIERALQKNGAVDWIRSAEDVRRAEAWLRQRYQAAVVLSGAGLALWLALRSRKIGPRQLLPATGVLLVGDLLWFGYGRIPQCEPRLNFPEIPALRAVTEAAPRARVIGYNCLPAKLSKAIGLADVRGYDSVDPSQWMAVLVAAADSRNLVVDYAISQWLNPRIKFEPPDRIRLSPILDMLAVRHVIFRGAPPAEIKPAFHSPDYWVMENRNALGRVYVPRRVQTVTDPDERFRRLGAADFDAREIALVESPINLPAECSGTAEITAEIPSRIQVKAQMATPGLLVLADLWDKGWRAYRNGQPEPILRVNHTLRGVVLPAGTVELDFRYEPASVRMSLGLAVLAALISLAWTGMVFAKSRQSPTERNQVQPIP